MLCGVLSFAALAQNVLLVTTDSDVPAGVAAPAGSLRWAMEEANRDQAVSVIQFRITTPIRLLRTLPPISDQIYPTILDGSSAPSRVRVDGSGMSPGSVFLIGAPGNQFLSFDVIDADDDVFNFAGSSRANLMFDVKVLNTRNGFGVGLLGSDDNIFVFCEFSGNAGAGVFAISGARGNIIGPGMRFQGNAAGGVLFSASPDNRLVGTPDFPIEFIDNDTFSIAVTQGSSGVSVGPWISVQGGAGNGILIARALTHSVNIEAVWVKGVSGQGIAFVEGARGGSVRTAIIEDCEGSALLVDQFSNDVTVDGTIILGRQRSTQTLVAVRGANQTHLRRVQIEGRGAEVGVAGVGSTDFLLEDSTIVGCESRGISLTSGSERAVLRRIRMEGGAPAVAGASGIVSEGIRDLAIEDCEILSFGQQSISIVDGSRALVQGNRIDDCRFGISLSGAAIDVDLFANAIHGVSQAGISLAGAPAPRVVGNLLECCGNGVVAHQHAGNAVIDANVIRGCSASGVYLFGGGNLATIVSNNLLDSNAIGVNVDNSPTLPNVLVVGNTFVYNATAGHSGSGVCWNNVFWQNGIDVRNPQFTDVQACNLSSSNPLVGVLGNVAHDPVFVTSVPFVCGRAAGDYHLCVAGATGCASSSPLIDVGRVPPGWQATPDRDGDPRPLGQRWDIGYDEAR